MGKISSQYKVLVTTSGVGARLGELAKYTNQSLVRLLKKPILSHIVESYPKDIEIVITLGYFGELVKEFLLLAYPERKFTFVPVDHYQGPGSSLVYSMLCAKKHLQCPFIFHAGDTVVMEEVPTPLTQNWCGGFKGQPNANYRSFIELDDKILAFRDKGAVDFDYLHIGLVGIKDFEQFWQAAEELYRQNPNNTALGDVAVLDTMIHKNIAFAPKEFRTWLDIGNLEALIDARQKLGDYLINLDKADQATFIFDEDFVIKFMADERAVSERVTRVQYLGDLVPEILGQTLHFYKYKFVQGRLYSRIVTPGDFKNFLNWAKVHLWTEQKEVSDAQFQKICLKFYKDKTIKRLNQFYEQTGIKDEAVVINGQKVPSLNEVLKQVDFYKLSLGKQAGFHGDFILDNIIRTPNAYVLLDWRQNFGGLVKTRDQYYDLAKLNHNLTINHDIVFQNLYAVKVRGTVVTCDIMRSENLVACQKVLWDFIDKEGYDLNKVQVLTAIVWLNMAPLHHHPYNYFLYYFGRLNLWKALQMSSL